ncbi:MAG: hypothetical protein Q4B23_04880 [Helcococcus sp.]|nr:hypothetical protein [Helcococcus sp.]
MKKNKKDFTIYIFFLTYYLSFILLLFETSTNIPQISDLEKILGNKIKLYFALIIISVLFLTIVFLIQYFVLKRYIKNKSDGKNNIAIPLLLTDTLLFVSTLLISFLYNDIIKVAPIINTFFGPVLFYYLLKDKLSRKDTIIAAFIKLIFYLTNLLLLII